MTVDNALALARSFKGLNEYQIAESLLDIYFGAMLEGMEEARKVLL